MSALKLPFYVFMNVLEFMFGIAVVALVTAVWAAYMGAFVFFWMELISLVLTRHLIA